VLLAVLLARALASRAQSVGDGIPPVSSR